MSAIDDFNTDLVAGRDAFDSADYTAALKHAGKARFALARCPNSWHGTAKIEWREGLDSLFHDIQRLQAGATGIQRSKVEYVNPT